MTEKEKNNQLDKYLKEKFYLERIRIFKLIKKSHL